MGDTKYIRRIYVPVFSIIRNETLPDEVITVYSIINALCSNRQFIDTCYMSVNEVARELVQSPTPTHRQMKRVKDGMIRMSEMFYETIESQSSDNSIWLVHIDRFSEYDFEKYRYAYFYDHDLRKITNSTGRNIFNEVSVYMKFLSCFDTRYNVCHISHDMMGEKFGISGQTMWNHLHQYVKDEIIKIIKPKTKALKDGGYYKYPNVYFRPDDTDRAMEYMEKYNDIYNSPFRNSQPPSG